MELNFRVWDTLEKRFLTNDEFTISNYGVHKVWVDEEQTYHAELGDNMNHRYIVMQFTGLRDINSKKLYFGDKFVLYYGKRKEDAYYLMRNLNDLYTLLYRIYESGAEFEIVGNMYTEENNCESI